MNCSFLIFIFNENIELNWTECSSYQWRQCSRPLAHQQLAVSGACSSTHRPVAVHRSAYDRTRRCSLVGAWPGPGSWPAWWRMVDNAACMRAECASCAPTCGSVCVEPTRYLLDRTYRFNSQNIKTSNQDNQIANMQLERVKRLQL